MSTEQILIIAAAISFVFSCISICVGLMAWVELRAMKMSTHTLQWIDPAIANGESKKIEEINKHSKEEFKQYGY